MEKLHFVGWILCVLLVSLILGTNPAWAKSTAPALLEPPKENLLEKPLENLTSSIIIQPART